MKISIKAWLGACGFTVLGGIIVWQGLADLANSKEPRWMAFHILIGLFLFVSGLILIDTLVKKSRGDDSH
jgi:hypothetical protein